MVKCKLKLTYVPLKGVCFLILDLFSWMFCSVCGAKNVTGVTNALFCGSCGARYSTAGPSMACNSLSFEEFMTQRASGGDQTFFNCAVKKADKVKQVERKLDGKKWKKPS